MLGCCPGTEIHTVVELGVEVLGGGHNDGRLEYQAAKGRIIDVLTLEVVMGSAAMGGNHCGEGEGDEHFGKIEQHREVFG